MTRHGVTAVVLAGLMLIPSISDGQGLGTFRWQLAPFCNSVSVAVTARDGIYTLDGFDDQCGAAQRAPLVGTATPNPDGSIGLGFHVVTAPSGRGLDVAVRISLASLSGPWSDSAGNNGTAVFNGTGGGSPRPLPAVPPSALAPGSIGASQIDPTQVQGRVHATCPRGHALTFVELDGRPHCTRTNQAIDTPPTGLAAYFSPSIAFTRDGSLRVTSFFNGTGRLRLVTCANAGCTSEWTARTLDDPGFETGRESSLAVGADGLPIVAHRSADRPPPLSILRVSRCTDVHCTTAVSRTIAWGVNQSPGHNPVLVIGRDGRPIIAAYDTTLLHLMVYHCDDLACSAVQSFSIDSGIVRPGESSVAMAIGSDGLPFLAYSYGVLGALRVAHCGDMQCATGNVYTTVDAGPGVGKRVAVAIGRDGLPIVAHQDDRGLRLTSCATVTCATGATTVAVEPGRGRAGDFPALTIGRDGLPIVAHHDRQQFRLRVTHCQDVRCANAVSTDMGELNSGTISMTLDPDGLPVIASFELSSRSIRITRCGSMTCQ